MQKSMIQPLPVTSLWKRIKIVLPKRLGERFFYGMFIMLVAIFFVVLLLPVVGIFSFVKVEEFGRVLFHPHALTAFYISIKTSFWTLALTFVTGTPTAIWLAEHYRTQFCKAVHLLLQLPLLFPPAVAGVGLLLAFGTEGILGKWLAYFHIPMVFTPVAVVVAQFFVASVLYVQVFYTAYRAIPKELFEMAHVSGANKVQLYGLIIFPILKKAIFSGLALTWIRAMGEFGATMMFAGNISGLTRTVPLQIYTFMQQDLGLAAALSGISFVVSFGLLVGVKQWTKL